MYLEFFNLRQHPFNNTPDTSLFYEGGDRGAILEALIYAILSGEGIVKVVGEVGSGKTMICRMTADRLPAGVELVFLLNPSLSPDNIFHAIANELGIPLADGLDRLRCLQILHKHLLQRHEEGRQVVVFIEEAQGMPLATLEEVRLLSNLETKTHKLMQIVLFGQPELDEKLAEHSIRQLRERISNAFNLPPLKQQEIAEYLTYRLWTAGLAGPTLFSTAAVREIAHVSGGVLRRVNILAHKSLLAAYVNNTKVVGRKEVRIATQDSEMTPKVTRSWSRWLIPAMASAFSLAAGIVFSQYLWQTGAVASPVVDMKPVAIMQPVTPPPQPAPVVATEAEAPPVATEAEAPPAPLVQEALPQPVVQEAKLQPVAEEPVALSSPPVVVANTPSPVEQTTALDVRPKLPEVVLDGLSLAERVKNTEKWLATAEDGRLSLQLMLLHPKDTNLAASLQKLYRDAAKDLNLADIHIFQLRNGRYLVYYGDYGSINEASRAIEALPGYLQRTGPYAKSLGSLRKEMVRIAWFQG